MIFSFHFPWWREEGRIPQKNHVYKFALGLLGLILISLAYYK